MLSQLELRSAIYQEVAQVEPFDKLERTTQQDILEWIDSGDELCRLEKPATPPKHLIVYFVVVNGDRLLLVDHINAELWLPPGGHVEPNEHPRATVLREAMEELSLDARYLEEGPVFLSEVRTVGKTAGHTDVSLWYVLRGACDEQIAFDNSEFLRVQWFHKDEVPLHRTDPHLSRFMSKIFAREVV